MMVSTLGLIITVAGLCFSVISMIIYVFGEKVGSEGTGRERIKVGAWIDVSTTPLLTLVLISFSFAMAPLALQYWQPDFDNYIQKDKLSRNYLPLSEIVISVYGSVNVQAPEGIRPADRVIVSAVRGTPGQGDPEWRTETDNQGAFGLELTNVRPGEEYWITWEKDGYTQSRRRIGFNEVLFRIVLESGESS